MSFIRTISRGVAIVVSMLGLTLAVLGAGTAGYTVDSTDVVVQTLEVSR